MNLEHRINLLVELGKYAGSNDPAWEAAQLRAFHENGWFYPEFIQLAISRIVTKFLQKEPLTVWAEQYGLPAVNNAPKNIGLIMAGNIPLVGFHDFLCLFISGHRQTIKPSTRDETLIRHLVQQLSTYDAAIPRFVSFAERLNGLDAYIATGSNNSARYFDYYFGKYPHIIRRNRTSVAILNGQETREELESLADDVYQYFGLGCRNVTKLYVPVDYDFTPLLDAFGKYNYLAGHPKYKNNYDYQLTLLILNKKYYMSNESILLSENPSPFSPISVLHYEYYRSGDAPSLPANLPGDPSHLNSIDPSLLSAPASHPGTPATTRNGTSLSTPPVLPTLLSELAGNPDIQCVVGKDHTPFGRAQQPELTDYADGVDTLQFLRDL